jgi:hypothetical protein
MCKDWKSTMSNFFGKLFKSSQVPTVPDYENWREIIFSTSSGYGLSDSLPNQVYGVVMDVGVATDEQHKPIDTKVVVSQTAFPTGESSVKWSNGGGFIGLGGDKEISEIAKQIISAAQSLLDSTKAVANHNLPSSGQIYFYFLTTSGIRLYESKLNDFAVSTNQPFAQIFSRFAWIKRRGEAIWNESQSKQAE